MECYSLECYVSSNFQCFHIHSIIQSVPHTKVNTLPNSFHIKKNQSHINYIPTFEKKIILSFLFFKFDVVAYKNNNRKKTNWEWIQSIHYVNWSLILTNKPLDKTYLLYYLQVRSSSRSYLSNQKITLSYIS